MAVTEQSYRVKKKSTHTTITDALTSKCDTEKEKNSFTKVEHKKCTWAHFVVDSFTFWRTKVDVYRVSCVLYASDVKCAKYINWRSDIAAVVDTPQQWQQQQLSRSLRFTLPYIHMAQNFSLSVAQIKQFMLTMRLLLQPNCPNSNIIYFVTCGKKTYRRYLYFNLRFIHIYTHT